MSLQQLRCFSATLDGGSFTAAAEALTVSQPAVAEQVRRLEQALGVDLFVRVGRGVRLTDAGRAFAEHATRTLRALEDATGSVGDLSTLSGGTLSLGVFSAQLAYRLDELAVSFLRRHPAMNLRLVGRNSSVAADRVRGGELEAAVVALPVPDAGLEVRPLMRDEVLYVSGDPARATAAMTIERFAAATLVFYDAESADADPIRRQLADRAQAHGLRARPRVEVETVETALRLVAAGLGDTYLPRAHTRTPAYPSGLSAVPFEPPMFDTLALVTRRAARVSPAMRTLVAELEEHLAGVAATLEQR